MKWQTECEKAYSLVVPYLRTILIKKLIDRGVPIRRASKIVGLSITSYEKHIKDDKIKKILMNEDINDMLDALANRLYSGDKIEPTTFCLVCSATRKIFDLPPCIF
ncbi:MAG: transcriptional regulator [Acidianus infernus]|uniref:transcriptional regulator n=1 Tax=Acidianus infernus TaxID=12915 RepID=UPI00227247F7|nr:transcriptional regulator [Acidianus infernus]